MTTIWPDKKIGEVCVKISEYNRFVKYLHEHIRFVTGVDLLMPVKEQDHDTITIGVFIRHNASEDTIENVRSQCSYYCHYYIFEKNSALFKPIDTQEDPDSDYEYLHTVRILADIRGYEDEECENSTILARYGDIYTLDTQEWKRLENILTRNYPDGWDNYVVYGTWTLGL